ncbi:MAG: hypothetical protein RL240_2115 [Planctomycetota bacterium]
MISPSTKTRPAGFTLLELLLALALTAVVSILIGGLVQLFLVNGTRGRDSVRQSQMARAILNMISEDVRSTVRYYPYDTSGLQQMLGGALNNAVGGALGGALGGAAGAGATGGGGASGGNAAGGGGIGGDPTGAAGGQIPGGVNPATGGGGGGGGFAAGGGQGGTGGAGGGTAGAGMSMGGASQGASGDGASGSEAGGVASVSPPGIYGSTSSIEIDVSRLPRPDEYVVQPSNLNTGAL